MNNVDKTEKVLDLNTTQYGEILCHLQT